MPKSRISKILDSVSLSFQTRMIIVVSVSVAVVIALASYFTFVASTRAINETVSKNYQELLALHSRDLENHIEELSAYSLTIRKDESLMRAILQDEPPGYHDVDNISRIKNIFYGRSDIYEFFLYLPRQERVYEILRSDRNMRIGHVSGIENDDWYIQASRGPSFIYYTPGDSYDAGGRRLFTLYRAIINIQDQQTLAIVKLSVSFENLARATFAENRDVFVFDENGVVMFTSNPEAATGEMTGELFASIQESGNETTFPVRVDGDPGMAIFNRSDVLGWTTVFVVPSNEIDNAIGNTQLLFILVATSALIVAILLISVLIKSQTRSFAKLVNQMSQVGSQSLNVRIDESGSPEIVDLARNVNAMLDRINELVEQNIVSTINEKEAQLKALDMQLNSHFLYNTLQAISAKAILAENRDVSNMINALAATLRYLIKADIMVRVESELAHIDNYFLLQKARFEERLMTTIVVEKEALKQYIPKLSIQTLAENSIKHGLERTLGAVSINIHIYIQEGYLYIKVSDDGEGISPERLAAVMEAIEEYDRYLMPKTNIGLQNLTERLNLLYNKQASFYIDSQEEGGTTSIIKIPYEGTDAKKKVQSTDN